MSGGLRFEFNWAKSEANREKHGIDFEAAQALWHDLRRIVRPVLRVNERRFLVTGLIDDKVWTAVITYRGAAIRLISVRRARMIEVNDYGANDDFG